MPYEHKYSMNIKVRIRVFVAVDKWQCTVTGPDQILRNAATFFVFFNGLTTCLIATIHNQISIAQISFKGAHNRAPVPSMLLPSRLTDWFSLTHSQRETEWNCSHISPHHAALPYPLRCGRSQSSTQRTHTRVRSHAWKLPHAKLGIGALHIGARTLNFRVRMYMCTHVLLRAGV